MSYYITAHKYNNKINIPIEEKHIYKTDSSKPSIYGYYGNTWFGTATQNNTLSLRQRKLSDYIDATGHSKTPKADGSYLFSLALRNPQLFYLPKIFKCDIGTEANQRIGEKIFMKSVKIMIDVKLMYDFFYNLNGNQPVNNVVKTYNLENYTFSYTGSEVGGVGSGSIDDQEVSNSIITYQDNRLGYSQWAKFRIMIVRFDDFDWPDSNPIGTLKNYFRDWFNKTYVPNFIVPITAGAEQQYASLFATSNQAKMLRESTEYTGKFKILYDEVFTLGDKDPMKHIEINLNPKKNLTFDKDGNITNNDWNNVFGFILPPALYGTDIDPITYRELMKQETTEATDWNIADFTTNIKFTYYDI